MDRLSDSKSIICCLYLLVFTPGILWAQSHSALEPVSPYFDFPAADSLEKVVDAEIQQLYKNLLYAYTREDSLQVAETLHRISTDYSSTDRWKRGEELALQALDIARKIEVDSTIASSLNALAISLGAKANNLHKDGTINQNQYLQLADSTITIFKQKLDVLEPLDLPLYKAYTYQGMGQIYIQTRKIRPKDAQKASEYFLKAIELAKTTDNHLLRFMTQIWNGIALFHQEKYSEIVPLLDKLEPKIDHEAINSLGRYMFYRLRLLTDLQLAGRDDLIQVLEQEYKYLKEFWSAEHNTQLAEMDRKYETQKTKRELTKQDKINELQEAQLDQRNIIIGIIALLLLCTGGGSYYLYRLNRKNRKLADNNAMLVREQNHRVKNNLQMISSLLSLQANRSNGTSKDTMLESSRRVQAIALLHRKLYDDLEGVKEVDMKEYTEELVEEILFVSGKTDIPVELEIDRITLPVEKAVHLALILNELVTNSIKHVFSRERLNGERIELQMAQPNGSIELTYRDNGGNFDAEAFKTTESLGNQIIRSHANYLADKFVIENDYGLKFSMCIKG